MRKNEYIASNERLITPSGLSLVGQVLGKSNLVKKANRMPVRHSTIKRRRIRTVIDNLILLAGHLTDHARKLQLALGHSNGWICTFLRIAEAF